MLYYGGIYMFRYLITDILFPVSFIAFLVLWYLKSSAKKKAGENYHDDENYLDLSTKKNIVGYICLVSFILGSLWGYQDSQKQKEYESNYNKNSAYYYENSSGQVENNQEKRSQEINNNINSYAEVNIDSMVKELDENALAASDKYKHKYLKITGGHLSVIDADGKYISLAGKHTFIKDVKANLTSPQQREQIKKMKRKQPLILYVKRNDVGEIMGYEADIIKIEVPH